VTRVRTTWLPTAEVRLVKPGVAEGVVTSMEELGELEDGAAVRTALAPLPAAYREWIGRQRAADPWERPAARHPEWRLFQLAFVLLNLARHRRRDARRPRDGRADLLPDRRRQDRGLPRRHRVHPAPRRLRGQTRPDGGLGVAVILRYTLRLLTLDQLGARRR
jgi:hypothetical protein